MHSTGVTIACLLLAVASVFGLRADPTVAIGCLAAGVMLVGLPHGGLDHWIGRRMLGGAFPHAWWVWFFAGYLSVSIVIVLGWWVLPTVTAVSFFLVAAWHFGVEDAGSCGVPSVAQHVRAVATGGLIIWVPAVFRPDEVAALLQAIGPAHLENATAATMQITRAIGAVAICVAVASAIRGFWRPDGRLVAARNLSFFVLFATADVLVSFGVYFCGWHSICGLKRLAREHDLSVSQVWWSAAPLSFGAVVLTAAGMVVWSSGGGLTDDLVRTVFVGLSAVAVPHLLLHGPLEAVLGGRIRRMAGSGRGQPAGVRA